MTNRSGTRGIRNNNPGNIDRNATKWQGMAADQSSDPRFIVFTSPQYGVRAMVKTLMTYQTQHKLRTVRKIIDRWAPPVENDTDAYVRSVARDLDVMPDATIDIDNCDLMLPLVKAIIRHENGKQPYSDAVLLEGIRMAGVHDVPDKPLVKQGAFQAQMLSGGALALGAVAEYAEPVKKAAETVAPLAAAPLVGRIHMILLTIAALALLAGMVSLWMKKKATGS